jgi:hypothetical protein
LAVAVQFLAGPVGGRETGVPPQVLLVSLVVSVRLGGRVSFFENRSGPAPPGGIVTPNGQKIAIAKKGNLLFRATTGSD